MSLTRLEQAVSAKLADLRAEGRLKGAEKVVTAIREGRDCYGPRVLLAGQGDKEFLRMNSNSYLGLSLHPEVIKAEEEAVRRFGAGPGAVRFISGTCEPHVELEKKLAAFHGREAGMIFSAAYAAIMGVLPQLITDETLVVSDELNHNSIINAIRLSRPAQKAIYRHLDMAGLEAVLKEHSGKVRRAVVVTDGIFSMRGDHAPLDRVVEVCRAYETGYEEGIITVVDDSHGVGAFGKTGRGTEEYVGARVDILLATLGKALGVNGGYVVASAPVVEYLRETSPFYIYSNPITPGEAAAAARSLEILDSPEGLAMLEKIRYLASRLREGFAKLGYETIAGDHPIVPLLVRDTRRTADLVRFLFDHGILATGLNYPVVPKGEEEIRFQVNASHTDRDVESLLRILKKF
ncbi:MAG: aminotransferase class I/II-fold pyridoxal phosphate-dependent enzyme [Nitrospirota bacterium]|nr:aminotransferase class I/II-fold pyridoxal phosphate-dependent enzyme [Nitrospirota bacterium]